MKKSLIFLCMITAYANAQSPNSDFHWQLINEWNFQTMSQADLVNEWNISPCDRALDHSNGNVEPQCYLPNNVTISNNGLKLEVKQEDVNAKVTCYLPNLELKSDGFPNFRIFHYTSGYAETIDSLKYGYIESRMKIPYGYDFFPAFWTFRTSSGNNAAEIDIFEMLPSDTEFEPIFPNNSNILKTNIHLCYAGCAGTNQNITVSDYTNYHTYAVEWSPTKIIWYFDNNIIRIEQNPGVHSYIKTIINLALTPFKNLDPNNTNYPASMMVDYVKWYKLNSDCNTVINDCSFWFSGYNHSVKKSISIGGSGCSNIQPVNTNLVLRATDFILLDGNFEVPLGSSFYLDVNACY